jgi:hypothetical protein
MLETGGGEKIFPSYHTEIARFLPNFFKKLGNFQTKRAPLMLNLAESTATLACTKRALFITKKGTFYLKKQGTFNPLKKLGGGHMPPAPLRFLRL